ncbi:14118_t:CDS:1, partial [Funneliformis geosporum]
VAKQWIAREVAVTVIVMGAEVEEVAMAKLVKALIKAKKKNFPLLKNKDCIENKLFRMLEI